MAKSDADATADVGEGAASSPPRRINVAVTASMMAAIDRLIENEGVTLTEAVRRLIAYGDLVYRSVRLEEQTMFFRDKNDKDREILLI